jgi:hypothetical protein
MPVSVGGCNSNSNNIKDQGQNCRVDARRFGITFRCTTVLLPLLHHPVIFSHHHLHQLLNLYLTLLHATEPFREPVDWKGLGLVDYPQLISQPMDLGTIKAKLKKREYKVPMELHKDVTLVWTNCMTYNQDGSDFYKLAASLKKKWDDKFYKLQKDLSVQGDAKAVADAAAATTSSNKSSASKASLADRRGFAKALYQISKEDLGKVRIQELTSSTLLHMCAYNARCMYGCSVIYTLTPFSCSYFPPNCPKLVH